MSVTMAGPLNRVLIDKLFRAIDSVDRLAAFINLKSAICVSLALFLCLHKKRRKFGIKRIIDSGQEAERATAATKDASPDWPWGTAEQIGSMRLVVPWHGACGHARSRRSGGEILPPRLRSCGGARILQPGAQTRAAGGLTPPAPRFRGSAPSESTHRRGRLGWMAWNPGARGFDSHNRHRNGKRA